MAQHESGLQHPLARFLPVFAGVLGVVLIGSAVLQRSGVRSGFAASPTPSPFPRPDVPENWRTYVNTSGYLIDYPPDLAPQEVPDDPGAAQFGPDIRSQIVEQAYTACQSDCPTIKEETTITLARRECIAVIAEPAAADNKPGPIYFYECPHDNRFFRFTYRPANGVESVPLRRQFARMANSVAFQ